MYDFMDLVSYLRKSPWTIELEHALERFSIRSYLERLDQDYYPDDFKFPEKFLNYLKDKVSNSRS